MTDFDQKRLIAMHNANRVALAVEKILTNKKEVFAVGTYVGNSINLIDNSNLLLPYYLDEVEI